LKENPDNVQAWVELGNAFFDINRFVDAINAYEKSLSIQADNPHVLTDLGVMYRRNNEPEKALTAFNKAITVQSDFETAWFNKGIVYMHDLNDLPKAIEAWEQLVKVNPTARTSGGQLVSEMVEKLKTQGR
jgi:tetratricopeptide (TPR) repeat protein